MTSRIYEMSEFDGELESIDDALFVFALDGEERSKYALNKFISSGKTGNSAIVFSYDNSEKTNEAIEKIKCLVRQNNVTIISGFPNSQYDFVQTLKECESITKSKTIVIDVSCIITPYLFLLIKCIYMWNKYVKLYAINTLPFDYSFSALPFVSYKSYYGDLKMEEILGFSSANGIQNNKDLFIFAGFEGALALKVEEDTDYNQLYYVNALPSYHQKYKDVSVINNYQLIVSKSNTMLFTPAINPFEVYNLLDKHINHETGASVAPLCTKPIALGICLFALEHENVRVIYPFSDRYESDRSHLTYKSYVYTFLLENKNAHPFYS